MTAIIAEFNVLRKRKKDSTSNLGHIFSFIYPSIPYNNCYVTADLMFLFEDDSVCLTALLGVYSRIYSSLFGQIWLWLMQCLYTGETGLREMEYHWIFPLSNLLNPCIKFTDIIKTNSKCIVHLTWLDLTSFIRFA